ncbi:M24 family metallopeptidase [Polaribacter tangerinus]|uniref:M24 family metallopeptidase n=1 Tax=Polaribacter tangerinus TaxID=1920034 RepID=UPI000B4B993F|nr:Xaa-Pro peptidase family protein [Polaribacter tangerinus]
MNKFGIGGSTSTIELAKITPKQASVKPIELEEYKKRVLNLSQQMKAQNIVAVYLNAGANLNYFTGTHWRPSERMVGAVVLQNADVHYIAPNFEKGTIQDFMQVKGSIHCWEEHENPHLLLFKILQENGILSGEVQVDETTPFSIIHNFLTHRNSYLITTATSIIANCRMIKSASEIAIMQHVMDITMEVHKAAAKILRVGITTTEVENFIHEAHKKYGIPSGSYFCIVLFGVDSSFPHGVKNPKKLEENDIVLVDTGCQFYDYISDITRTYVFGKATEKQERIWNIEKETQQAAFEASILGNTCSDIDTAARSVLEKHHLGPDYNLPGLPHRTGHGIGLEIHEYPYLLKGNETILKPGMTFSNEPMICVPNEFGIRLEDHIYITKNGPKWFTNPAYSIYNPFGI